MLGVGLALPQVAARRASAPEWTPAKLFAASEAGAWYDPSDLSTLWQDTAGTTPVTADGQSVARIDDKSGNGNHLTQATASKRPVYRTAGGLHWLLFDGVDDFLRTSAFAAALAQPNHICLSGRHGLGPQVYLYDGIATSNRHAILESTATTGTAFQMFAGTISADIPADAADHVYSALFNGAASNLRTDGVASAAVDAGTQSLTGLTLGARFTDVDPMAGRIYEFVLHDNELTGDDLSNLEAYLAGKAGVTL